MILVVVPGLVGAAEVPENLPSMPQLEGTVPLIPTDAKAPAASRFHEMVSGLVELLMNRHAISIPVAVIEYANPTTLRAIATMLGSVPVNCLYWRCHGSVSVRNRAVPPVQVPALALLM